MKTISASTNSKNAGCCLAEVAPIARASCLVLGRRTLHPSPELSCSGYVIEKHMAESQRQHGEVHARTPQHQDTNGQRRQYGHNHSHGEQQL